MTAVFPVVETPTSITPPTSSKMKVADYYHINGDVLFLMSAYTSYAYRVSSFIVNGVELVSSPITSTFWTTQNLQQVPTYPANRKTIPNFFGKPGWNYDKNFVDFMNSLGISGYSFYPSGLSAGYFNEANINGGLSSWKVDYNGDLVYGEPFQIERPEDDVFEIRVDALYNGSSTAGHTMVFSNHANILDGVKILTVYTFSGNVY